MVKVWLYNEGVPTHVGVGHAGVVTNVKVSPDGRFVVSTSADGGIFLWRFPHAADIAPPGSRCSVNSGGCSSSASGSPREQQVDRSRELSLKKTLPARKENIKVISKAQKVRASDGPTAGRATSSVDGNVNSTTATDRGSIKCLCRRESTCTCCADASGNTDRKSTSSVQ
jgi:WD40 repeat protein